MIVTRTTTALMLAMSLLATGPTLAVKVFADNDIIQDSGQQTDQSTAAQINQPGDGDGDRVASIDLENNAVNLDRQEVNIGDNSDDNTIQQLSGQQTDQSTAAQINQPGDGDGDRVASIDLENNAVNLDRQEVNIGDNSDDNTIQQLSGQQTDQSTAALIDQPGDGDGDRVGDISEENNSLNDHCQNFVGPVETTITTPCPLVP